MDEKTRKFEVEVKVKEVDGPEDVGETPKDNKRLVDEQHYAVTLSYLCHATVNVRAMCAKDAADKALAISYGGGVTTDSFRGDDQWPSSVEVDEVYNLDTEETEENKYSGVDKNDGDNGEKPALVLDKAHFDRGACQMFLDDCQTIHGRTFSVEDILRCLQGIVGLLTEWPEDHWLAINDLTDVNFYNDEYSEFQQNICLYQVKNGHVDTRRPYVVYQHSPRAEVKDGGKN